MAVAGLFEGSFSYGEDGERVGGGGVGSICPPPQVDPPFIFQEALI